MHDEREPAEMQASCSFRRQIKALDDYTPTGV